MEFFTTSGLVFWAFIIWIVLGLGLNSYDKEGWLWAITIVFLIIFGASLSNGSPFEVITKTSTWVSIWSFAWKWLLIGFVFSFVKWWFYLNNAIAKLRLGWETSGRKAYTSESASLPGIEFYSFTYKDTVQLKYDRLTMETKGVHIDPERVIMLMEAWIIWWPFELVTTFCGEFITTIVAKLSNLYKAMAHAVYEKHFGV